MAEMFDDKLAKWFAQKILPPLAVAMFIGVGSLVWNNYENRWQLNQIEKSVQKLEKAVSKLEKRRNKCDNCQASLDKFSSQLDSLKTTIEFLIRLKQSENKAKESEHGTLDDFRHCGATNCSYHTGMENKHDRFNRSRLARKHRVGASVLGLEAAFEYRRKLEQQARFERARRQLDN
jgi:hypothetical protein